MRQVEPRSPASSSRDHHGEFNGRYAGVRDPAVMRIVPTSPSRPDRDRQARR